MLLIFSLTPLLFVNKLSIISILLGMFNCSELFYLDKCFMSLESNMYSVVVGWSIL